MWITNARVVFSMGGYITVKSGLVYWVIGRNGDCVPIGMPAEGRLFSFAIFNVAGSRYIYWGRDNTIIRRRVSRVDWGAINWACLPTDIRGCETEELVWQSNAKDERVAPDLVGQYQNVLVWRTNAGVYTLDVETGELGAPVPFPLENTIVSGIEISEIRRDGEVFYTQNGYKILQAGECRAGTWSDGIWTARKTDEGTEVLFYKHNGEIVAVVKSAIEEVCDAEYIMNNSGDNVAVITSYRGGVEIVEGGKSKTESLDGHTVLVVMDRVFCDDLSKMVVWALDELRAS